MSSNAGGSSEETLVQDLNEETFEVSTTLRVQGVFQSHVVLLQVHVLDCLQVDLWGDNVTLMSHTSLSMLCFDEHTHTHTHLRAAHDDADECVLIGAQALHGSVEAAGEEQLWVLGTPDCGQRQRQAV